MSRYHSYINTAEKIIGSFKGETPFAIYLKNFFSAEKKYGSKDRKQIASLCYNYYRIGFAANNSTIHEKISIAFFLCSNEPSEMMNALNSEWNEYGHLPLNKKVLIVKKIFSLVDIFPFTNKLSVRIDVAEFCRSFLIQPDVFLRIRPKEMAAVNKKLNKAKLPFTLMENGCIQLPSTTTVDEYLATDKEVVIQDFNSQKVLDYLKYHQTSFYAENIVRRPLSVWDCCAASGGKSILAYDILNGAIALTVSDIRAGIILNLHQRFKKAAIKEYNYFIADISKEGSKIPYNTYDVIICDVPCTGSGTWSRTPDQLYFFKENALEEYSSLQKKIAASAMPHLKKGGIFFYITCSVFKMENEVNAAFIQEQFNLQLMEMQLLKGYEKKADSMFVAVFKK